MLNPLLLGSPFGPPELLDASPHAVCRADGRTHLCWPWGAAATKEGGEDQAASLSAHQGQEGEIPGQEAPEVGLLEVPKVCSCKGTACGKPPVADPGVLPRGICLHQLACKSGQHKGSRRAWALLHELPQLHELPHLGPSAASAQGCSAYRRHSRLLSLAAQGKALVTAPRKAPGQASGQGHRSPMG